MGQSVFQNRPNPFTVSKFYKQSIKEFNSQRNYMGVGLSLQGAPAKLTYLSDYWFILSFAVLRGGRATVCDLGSL